MAAFDLDLQLDMSEDELYELGSHDKILTDIRNWKTYDFKCELLYDKIKNSKEAFIVFEAGPTHSGRFGQIASADS